MITYMENYELVEKEKIEMMRFPSIEVLESTDLKQERLSNLNRALTLGNLEHNKIKILFEDEIGKKIVETTVWGVTDKRIILKQGVVIPIHRVHAVKI
ncbi:MAG: hypothetical protein QM534_04405 [Sediminibacterium sp.]|nr:hypothetical protein [Sediminibacterium sp.]